MGDGYNHLPTHVFDHSRPAYEQPGPAAMRVSMEAQAGGRVHPTAGPRQLYARATFRDVWPEWAAILAVPAFFGVSALIIWAADKAEAEKQMIQKESGLEGLKGAPRPGAHGRSVLAQRQAERARAARAEAVLAEPGSDHYRQEFTQAGERATELADLYGELLTLVDPDQQRFTSPTELEQFRTWHRTAYGFLPDTNQEAAAGIAYRISNLQASVGITPMTEVAHPLHATLRAADAMMRPTPALARTTPGR